MLVPPSRLNPASVLLLRAAFVVATISSHNGVFAQQPPVSPAPTPAPSPAPTPVPNPAPTKDGAQQVLPSVEVQGQRNATEERRTSSAAKIVIDRATIEQYGDTNLGEVLRRMPGVTQGGRPGRGGDIRMRGMGGGFTQILIDGERIPPGFSMEQITPEQVERIEIIRAPTAETGTRAIAGTINIILREPLRKLANEVRAGLTEERGRVSGNASWSHNDTLGPTSTYNLTASTNYTDQLTDTRSLTTHTDIASGATTLAQESFSQSHEQRTNLFASGRVQWRLGQGESVLISPFIVSNRGETTGNTALSQTFGAQPAAYARRQSVNESDFALLRINAALMKRLTEQTRMEARASIGRFNLDVQSRAQQDGGSQPLTQSTETDTKDTSWNASAKFTHDLDGKHTITSGVEFEQTKRVDNSVTLLNNIPVLPEFGSDLNIRTNRRAVYIQDEWDIAPTWSANVGLRWEGLETRSDVLGEPVRNKSSVLSPLGHVVWRFSPASRDQLRLSLTQSYRAPNAQQLVARPSLNTQFPVPGANNATNPDRAGNAALRPETAKGIDLAYEKYLKSGGIVSVNLFARQIDDLIRNVTALEAVPWASAPRWVTRPQNLEGALTKGVEFDFKFQLQELVDGAIPLNMRFNLSLYDSSVKGVPGPNNTIDQQPRATGNLGADYRFRGTPWSVGGNIAYTPAYDTQLTEFQSQSLGSKRVLEAYALYNFNAQTRLRLSFANIAPRDSVSSSTIVAGNESQTVQSFGRTDMSAGLRLEIKL
jgi:outer membrane receptor for ferrienterochelin and colicins